MNRSQLPAPPNPDNSAYAGNVIAWQRAVYNWMAQVKGRLETDSQANTTPIGPFVVGTYTAVSTITGTDDASNFIATLVTAMNQKGITAPNVQRTTR